MQRSRDRNHPDQRQRGVALIAASVAMAILGAIVVEFSTNTTVDIYAAKNAELDMKAHFLAQSGMNLAELVLNVQKRLDSPTIRKQIGDIQLADFVPQLIGAFGGSKEERDSWAELVGGTSGDDIKGLGVPEGEFSLDITTEDKKINLNCAKDSATAIALQTQLFYLFLPEAYNPIFESADGEGWQRDRETQIKSIIDYIDEDPYVFEGESGLGARVREDYGYETLRDKYKPKDRKIDTTDEIKLARGVDDRLWNLFGSSFTVYGDCKINLTSVDDVKLIAALIASARKENDDPVVNDPVKLWTLAQKVTEAREFGLSFGETQEFIDFVKDPAGGLAGFVGERSAAGLPSAPVQSTGPPVEGVELDKAKLEKIATTGPRVTYRVEATALVQHGGLNVSLEKRIVGIWDSRNTKQNSRAYGNQNDPSKGRWVYWRED